MIFDIETGPLDREYVLGMHDVFPPYVPPEPFDPNSVKYGNTKDEGKRKQKYEETYEAYQLAASQAPLKYEQDRQDYEDKIIREAALSPLTARVLCIGYWFRTQNHLVDDSPAESDLLIGFWDAWAAHNQSKCIGFNIFNFDLPFLVKRSWANGIRPPESIRKIYWHDSFLDLMQVFAMGNRDSSGRISLSRLSRFLLGREKDRTGERFWELWESDRSEALLYVRNDIEITRQLAERMGVLKRWE